MAVRVYMDYNASAPLLDSVRDAMVEGLALFGNASSVHGHGRAVRGAIEATREVVSEALGARAQDVIFTSGGTEANNLALTPSLFKKEQAEKARLFVSAIEHPSVLNGMRFERDAISVIPVTADGVVDLDWLEEALFAGVSADELAEGFAPGSRPLLVSVMAANNETGVIQPMAALAELVHRAGGLLHSDCVQAFGKFPLSMAELGADLISLSAHKIGGPQGVGALVLRDESITLRAPLVAGGGQELKRRGGTENLIGILGFGAAVKALASGDDGPSEEAARLGALRTALEDGIAAIAPDAVIFGKDAARCPHVCCFGVPGFSAETQVIQFDLKGVSISSGSACSSGKVERSHVLSAMGVGDDLIFSALRLSLGRGSTEADIERFLEVWGAIYKEVKKRQPQKRQPQSGAAA